MVKYLKTFLMIILVSMLICAVVSFVVLFSGKHLQDGFNRNNILPMMDGWTLSDEDYSNDHTVSLPISGNEITLLNVGPTYHLAHYTPSGLTNSFVLSIPMQSSRITVCIDSIERFNFTGTGGLPNNNLPSSGFLLVPLSVEDSGKLLEITVSSKT